MMDFISEHKRYFITAGIGIVMTIALCFSRGVLAAESEERVIAIISDAFLLPGMLFLFLGIILHATNEGLFNALAYGMKILGRSFAPPKGEKIIQEEFHEYHARVSKKKTKVSHFIVVGCIFLAISILLAIVYVV